MPLFPIEDFPSEPPIEGYSWVTNVPKRGYRESLSPGKALRQYSRENNIPLEELMIVQATLDWNSYAIYRKVKPIKQAPEEKQPFYCLP